MTTTGKGSKATLSRAGRIKMSEYYHDHLWQVKKKNKKKPSLLCCDGDAILPYVYI